MFSFIDVSLFFAPQRSQSTTEEIIKNSVCLCVLCGEFYLNQLYELIEKELRIRRTAGGFGMELGREPRIALVADAFV